MPTFTREVSTFAYGDRPDFSDDPFLMSDVDSAQVMTLSDPQRQARVRTSGAAEAYGRALEIAQARTPQPPPGPLLSSLTKIITGSESKQPAGPNAHPLVVRL